MSRLPAPGLTPEEREHFLRHGYVLIKQAMPRDFALAQVHDQFLRHGMDAHHPHTWKQPRMSFPPTQHWATADIAPRLWAAACDILGTDHLPQGKIMSNAMAAQLFVGEGEPWREPGNGDGWHKDGHFFRHFLDSPEQALLSLPLWSDVVEQGGGTFIAPQSVAVVARYLAAHPEGIHPAEFPVAALMRQCPRRIEAVGSAGDVYLMHGYMLHSASVNPNRKLRCISNNIFALNEPLNFNRATWSEYSLLEQAILKGLGADRLDFKPLRERLKTPDFTELPRVHAGAASKIGA